MARGGRATVQVDFSEFERNLKATVVKVERGTKKATLQWIRDIEKMSIREVPLDTGTLMASFFSQVEGNYRIGFTGIVGYGDPHGGANVNEKTGKEAEDYMVAVHEDLSVPHKIGKAKFLEDPINEYKKVALAKALDALREELY